jgi:hypothetical protein
MELNHRHQRDGLRPGSPRGVMTASIVPAFMASLFEIHRSEVHLLDAGAGAGALSAA